MLTEATNWLNDMAMFLAAIVAFVVMAAIVAMMVGALLWIVYCLCEAAYTALSMRGQD